MRDPHEIDTDTIVECDVCEAEITVTFWDNLRTGEWEREAFTCNECGEHHQAIHGNALDRGAGEVGFTIRTCGWALVLIGALGHSHWSWPLIVTGVALVAAVRIVTAYTHANRIVKEATHE